MDNSLVLRVGKTISAVVFYVDGAAYDHAGLHELRITHDAGAWMGAGGQAEFRWEHPPWSPADFFSLRAAEVGRAAKTRLLDPTSSLRFSFDWLKLTLPEKQALFSEFRRKFCGRYNC